MPAYSFVQYTGDGSTGPFIIPFPYLDRTHLSVKVDTVEASFSFDTDSAISLTTAAPSGAVIEIRRRTPASERLVDFTDGSVLTEIDLDTALLQQMYLAQETLDLSATAITLGSDGGYDFASRRAVSLADPSDSQDAATKAYVDSTTATSAAAAAASASAAAASETNAATDAAEAASAATGAQSAQTAAETAQTAAETAAASINGIPSGGSTGQIIIKQSGADFDVAFGDAAGGVEIVAVAAAPDADDDDSNTGGHGTFSLGSQWRDTTTNVLYVCVDASTGAAVWHAFNVQSGLIGEVVAWPAAAIPSGWLECNGQAVSRTTYAALFSAIGTTFGSGDGSTTFNLPDLRGEFIRGFDNGASVDSGRVFGSNQTGQVGDHKHQQSFNSSSNFHYNSTPPFGTGDNFARTHALSGAGTVGTNDYNLTDKPYDSVADEATQETRPRNVALKYIIRAASTYNVADLTPNMPEASEATAGALRKATQVEVDGGTETDATVSPAYLQSWKGHIEDLISEGTVSAGSAADWVDLNDSQYRMYRLAIDECIPSVDSSSLLLFTSGDNGSNFDSSSGDYDWSHVELPNSVYNYNSSSTAAPICLARFLSNVAAENLEGNLWLINPTDATYDTRIRGQFTTWSYTSNPRWNLTLARRKAAAIVDAMRLAPSSGTMSFQWKLFGVL